MIQKYTTDPSLKDRLRADPGDRTWYIYLNTTVPPTGATYGIPFPGTFIVNASGVVTSRFFEAAYQERNTVASVLVKLGAKVAAVAATKVSGTHLTLTTYATDAVAAPGTRFSIVADVVPGSRIHVYAPGASICCPR